MIMLALFAFLAGIVTILSPCILPVAPIVLSGSLSKGKARPLGILFGFVMGFSALALSLTAIVEATGIPANNLRFFAVFILGLMGMGMIFPALANSMKKVLVKALSFGRKKKIEKKESFWGGILAGLSLGFVWTPCAGPILASVIVLTATSGISASAFLIVLAYSLGTALAMSAIIFGGRGLLNKVPSLKNNLDKIQVAFGVLVIFTAISIHLDWDKQFQNYFLDKFPGYGAGLTQLENSEIVTKELEKFSGLDDPMKDLENQEGELCENTFGRAADFISEGEWLNSEALSVKDLEGKIVLVDFWTYSCINCIRTLPFLRGWHEKYADDGLVIVGVHTPEFEFEKDTENVKKALSDFDLDYPVVQDNDYKIWRAYENRYWPAKYLLDGDGCIRYKHFGEGEYKETEETIQRLLEEAGMEASDDFLDIEEYRGEERTHETYLGYGRMDLFASQEEVIENEELEYSSGFDLQKDYFAYDGLWTVGYEKATAREGSKLLLNFTGKEVYLVMNYNKDFFAVEEGTENLLLEDAGKVEGEDEEELPNAVGLVKLYLDGEELAPEYYGDDVNENATIQVFEDKLYKLIKFPELDNSEEGYYGGKLEIEVLTDGIEVFAFTFG